MEEMTRKITRRALTFSIAVARRDGRSAFLCEGVFCRTCPFAGTPQCSKHGEYPAYLLSEQELRNVRERFDQESAAGGSKV